MAILGNDLEVEMHAARGDLFSVNVEATQLKRCGSRHTMQQAGTSAG